MAFLRGTMTYQELLNGKLFQLLTGEISDDFGVTAGVGVAWERVTTTVIAAPGDSVNNPTNINNVQMRMNWVGETAAQQAVSFTIQAKRPVDGAFGTVSNQMRIQVFSNGALVNATDLIAYWISVTKDRIIIAIQGDTNHSGNMNLIYVGTYTRLYTSTQDPYPVMGMVSHMHESEYTFNTQPRSQICRTDNAGWLEDRDSSQHRTATANAIIGTNPNSWDNKWYLYTLYVVTAKTTSSSLQLGYRGKMLDISTLSNVGWSNRDILTNGVDSWRLIFPFRSNDTATAQNPLGLANSGLVYFAFKQS